MTFKKQIEEANAARDTAAAAAEEEKKAKKVELSTIADKLEAHLRENKPSEVGLVFEREGARMKLKSSDFTIVIDPSFQHYNAMVLGGMPPTIARGSQTQLRTLADVDAYILGIINR